MSESISMQIARWDDWFAATKDETSLDAWAAAKEVWDGEDVNCLIGWALLIELNRLAILEKA